MGLPAGGTSSTLAPRERDGPVRSDQSSSSKLDQVTGRDVVMDYEKMKALMEASREESLAQRRAQFKEFPKPDSRPDWKYLDYVQKEQIAA